MKKMIIAGIVTTVMALTTVSANAKVLYYKSINEEVARGKSIEDACGATAIFVLGDENVMGLIYQKQRELGDWEKTAEYYGVNINEFRTNIENYKKEIPDDVYDEMKSSGMTDDECYDFARLSKNAQMDIAVTWEAKKNGKTIDDLIREETALNNKKLQAATDYAFEKITATEYTEKMQSLSPDMNISDILAFAQKEKKGWMEFRKATSGITDDELKAAADAGITDFFAACRLKDAEKSTNKTFTELLEQLGEDKDVDKVIRDNSVIRDDLSTDDIGETEKNTETAE